METFDVVVIGGGPGGYPAAIRAAQLGASVALVEQEALGGTCLNWGCIPTKALIASADLYHKARHGAEMGVQVDGVSCDFAAMSSRKDAIVERLCGGVGQLLKANGVKVYHGRAAFTGRNRIRVNETSPSGKSRKSGKTGELQAANTIIATGSLSAVPGFLPRSPRVVESRAFLENARLPDSLIVLGGGVIGCEFACLAARLGRQVTVVEMLDDILMVLDPDLRRELRRHMAKTLGIRVIVGQKLEAVQAGRDGVTGRCGEDELSADMLLVSVGRRPCTDGLDLEQAGLEADAQGAIPVHACCRTAAATVYAVGDVTSGSTQLAHAATAQGIAAAENACGAKRRPAETLVPACIFTSPEIGSVGLTEQGAKETGRAVKTGKFQFGGLGKALAANEPEGFVKWIVDAETDQLLGAHAVGAHATELVAEAAVAIRAELTAEELGRTIHCHPTLSESWMEAAHAVHGACVHQPPRRK